MKNITEEEALTARIILAQYIAQMKEYLLEADRVILAAKSKAGLLADDFDLHTLDLSVRAYNSIKIYQAKNLHGLPNNKVLFNLSKSALLMQHGCGKKTVREIEHQLSLYSILLLP